MGYLYLVLALAFGITKAYCGKRSSFAATSSYNSVLINTVRMTLCVLIGAVIVLASGIHSLLLTTPKLILFSLLCAVGTAAFTVSWILAVRTLAYMLVEVFVMAGVVIPLTLCSIIYKEPIGTVQIVGVLLLLVAVYLMCTYKKAEKVVLSAKSFLLLLLCSASSGLCDFSQKLYAKEIKNVDVSVFNLYTYIFAAIILFSIFLIFQRKQKRKGETPPPTGTIVKPIIHYVSIMAVALFLNAYFKTMSAKYLDAILLYPLSNGCAVILSLLMSIFIFKEKITAKGILGIALAVISIILINVIFPN